MRAEISASSPALFFWVSLFGLQAGDQQTFRLVDPTGTVLLDGERTVERNAAVGFPFLGKKAPESGFPAGRYRAEYRLVRSVSGTPTTVIQTAREVELK